MLTQKLLLTSHPERSKYDQTISVCNIPGRNNEELKCLPSKARWLWQWLPFSTLWRFSEFCFRNLRKGCNLCCEYRKCFAHVLHAPKLLRHIFRKSCRYRLPICKSNWNSWWHHWLLRLVDCPGVQCGKMSRNKVGLARHLLPKDW